jgi:hypothetical protein
MRCRGKSVGAPLVGARDDGSDRAADAVFTFSEAKTVLAEKLAEATQVFRTEPPAGPFWPPQFAASSRR